MILPCCFTSENDAPFASSRLRQFLATARKTDERIGSAPDLNSREDRPLPSREAFRRPMAPD